MKFRIIPRLDIKKDKLIKGIHLEGLRVVGEPVARALEYYQQGADELLLVDAVASLYQRNQLTSIVSDICKEIFIPITVGGGIRSIEDAQALFNSGADKIAVNTAAISNPRLLSELSGKFGSQAIVLSIQARRDVLSSEAKWIAMTDAGRESSGKCVLDWICCAQQLGIGEILVTSVDQEGTGTGFDLDLVRAVSAVAQCPILASGGFGCADHAFEVFEAGAQAGVIAQSLHYSKTTIATIKGHLVDRQAPIRVTSKNIHAS
jgi:cyclase